MTDVSYLDSSQSKKKKKAFAINHIISINYQTSTSWPKPRAYKNSIICHNIPRPVAHLPETGLGPVLKTNQSILGICRVWTTQVHWVNSFLHRMFLSEPLGYKAHEIVFRMTRHFLQSSSQYVVTASENADKNSFYWSHVPTEEIHFCSEK